MMRKTPHLCVAFLFLTVLMMATPANSQAINVTVDGEAVQFEGTRPMSVSGRVLVPLRGVLEKMGALVGWIPETKSVVAEKGDTYIELPVGSTTARVNGRKVILDVPATIIGGSTMVPLRFVGEAFGADVRWDAISRTVLIDTVPAPETDGTTPQVLSISSFSHNATTWLRAGSQLQVIMKGTVGGTASFEIPGVVDQTRMREDSPGSYSAIWTVPSTANLTVSGASVLGLLRAGAQERLIQAGTAVSIDTMPPKVKNMLPAPDSTVAQSHPSISAVLDDAAGSGIDEDSVQLTVNDTDVTAQSTVTAGFVSYRPPNALTAGVKTVVISVRDKAGNAGSGKWNLTVRGATDVIKSFTYTALAGLQPGDVITVRMETEPGGTASFSLVRDEQKLRTVQMQEASSGVHTGEYTIRKDDNLTGASIVGSFTKGGVTYTTQTPEQIAAPTGTLTPPVISSPKAGASVVSPITIVGTAPASTKVQLKLEYATTVLGALRMTGTVTEQLVDVDKAGKFKTEPIALGTMIKGKNTEYTLTAITIGPGDKESKPTVVTFKGG